MLKLKLLPIIIKVIVALSIGQEAFGQKRQLDSLAILLNYERNPSKRIKLYNEIAWEYSADDFTKANDYIDSALSLAIRNNADSLTIIQCWVTKSRIATNLGNFEEALRLNLFCLGFAKRHNYERMLRINSLLTGRLFNLMGKFDTALKYYYESYRLREKHGDLEEIAVAALNIGHVYYKLVDPDNSIKYSKIALGIFDSKKAHSFSAAASMNIALAYLLKKDIPNANFFANESRRYCKLGNCLNEYVLNLDFAFGMIEQEKGQIGLSMSYFEKSLGLAKQIGDRRVESEVLYYLGRNYVQLGQLQEADFYFDQSLNLAYKHSFNQILLAIYKEKMLLTSLLDRPKQEFYWREQYLNQLNNVYGKDKISEIADLHAGFAQRKNVDLIRVNSELHELKAHALKIKEYSIYALLVTSMILFILLISLYRLNLKRRRINKRLEEIVFHSTRRLEEEVMESKYLQQELTLVLKSIQNEVNKKSRTIKGLCSIIALDRSLINPENPLRETKFSMIQNYLKAADDLILPGTND